MSNLLKAFDSYGDFSRDLYFTLFFDAIASTLYLELPLVASKSNMNLVLKVLDIAENYEVSYKTWQTEDVRNGSDEQDFPYQLLLKGTKQKALIWITLENDTLDVNFSYDAQDAPLEQYILEMNNRLREKFGLAKSPTFKVLTKPHRCFTTEEVRTEPIQLNLSDNYNDDFVPVHAEISQSIQQNNSGLILLYGKPGTGKTTYIRSLIAEHQSANFIFIQNEFVKNLLDPDFISFLLKQRNSTLVIEDAEKVLISRENAHEESVVSTILQLTDGLFSDYLNIKVICTFNTSLAKIDTALLRKGRMIAMYEFKPLSVQKANRLLNDFDTPVTDQELTVADIYNRNRKAYGNVEQRKIGF